MKSLYWRILFLGFVLFLCLITFETMFNGFERNFANLNRAIDERAVENANFDQEKQLLEMRRAQILKFTEDELLAEVATSRQGVSEQFDAQTATTTARLRGS